MKFFYLILLLQTMAFSGNEVTAPITTVPNDLFSPATILAVTVSFITLIGVMGSAFKKLLVAVNLENEVNDLRIEVDAIKSDRDTHAKVINEVFDTMKEDIKNKASVEIYSDLEDLETKVDNELNKLRGTVIELSHVESKLNELKSHFDDTNSDRRNEIKELTDTVKGLRDNMRDDVNDVKSIIMKLMMNLKISND